MAFFSCYVYLSRSYEYLTTSCDMITDFATSVTSCFLMTSHKNPTDKDTTKDMRSVSMMKMDDFRQLGQRTDRIDRYLIRVHVPNFNLEVLASFVTPQADAGYVGVSCEFANPSDKSSYYAKT